MVYGKKVNMSGPTRPAVVTLLRSLLLSRHASDQQAVFTIVLRHSYHYVFDHSRVFWGVGMARGTCRVRGVKMGFRAVTPERLGRLRSNLVCG